MVITTCIYALNVGFSTCLYFNHIQVICKSYLGYYLGQWVIWASDADLVSTLVYTLDDAYCNASRRVEWYREFLNSFLDVEEANVHTLVLEFVKLIFYHDSTWLMISLQLDSYMCK